MRRIHGCKVLSYHRVMPAELISDQVTQRSLMVSTELFRRQMLYLRERYTFLTPDQLVRGLQKGAGFPTASSLITFDDGWRDNYFYAFPILKELKIPATLFVAVDHVETGKDFWPERLARLLSSLERTERNAKILRDVIWLNQAEFLEMPAVEYANLAVIALKPKSLEQIEDILIKLEQTLDSRRNYIRTERSICYWHEIQEMLDSGIFTIGSHTLSHVILINENQKKREDEIIISKQILEDKLNSPILHFAYPNGSFDGATEKTVKRAGYLSAFTCLNGTNSAPGSPYRIRRIHISEPGAADGFSQVRFSIRISGIYQQMKRARNMLAKQY